MVSFLKEDEHKLSPNIGPGIDETKKEPVAGGGGVSLFVEIKKICTTGYEKLKYTSIRRQRSSKFNTK